MKSIGKIFSAIMCACVMLLTYGSIFASAMGLEKRYEIKKSLPEYLADEIDLSSVKDIKESGSNNEITLSLNDGTYTTYTYSENVWYESSSGIKFKDTAIEKQDNKALEKEGYAYTVADNDDSADFSTDSSKGIRVTNNGVTFTLAPISTATGKSNGKIVKADGSDTFVYEDAYGAGTDLAFVPQLNGIKEEIILSEYNGCNSYKFNLEVNSGTPVIKDGCLCFKDNTTGAVVSKTELPYAYDSKGNQTSDCSYTLCKSGKDKYILTLSVSDQWLKSKKTVYPVVIDPTSVNAETQYDTTVYTSKMFNKNSSCGANDNEVGYRGLTYGYARSLVSVDIPSSVTKGSIINSAKYYAKQTNSKSSNKYIDVYALTSSWNEDTVYGGAPSYDSTKISQRLVNKSNNSGTADSTWFDFDITGAVSDWVNGRKTNYGVMLKYSSESFSLFSDYRVFASKENSSAANKPYTVINYTPDTTSPVYTSVTGAPDGWTNKNVALTVNGASDSGAGLAATAYSFSTARGIYNWQSSNVSESFSGSGTIYVYVRDAADNITYCGSYDLKIDKDAPTVEKVIGNPETWTYKDVTLKVEGISDGNGEGAAELPYSFSTAKGTYNWQASNKKTFKNNQTVYIYTRDKQGNIALVDTEVIGKISNTAPAVTAGTVTSSKISVSWSAINGAQSYELVCNGKIYSGITGTNYTFSGLTAGKTYEIEARAVGENGKGPWSDKISVTASAGTVVTTDYIRSDTEWKKENGPYYINGDLSIEDGVTLTIDEGVTVIVSPVTGSAGRIGIEGTLNIKGTSDEPVIFKSKNGENTSSWNGMIVFSSGTLNIDNAEIYDVRNPDTANDTQTDFNAYNAIINYNNDTTKSGNITVKNTKFRDCDTAVSCSGNMNSIIDIENCDIAARYDGIDIINTSTCDINVKNNKISAEKLIGLTLYYVAGKDMTVTGNIIKNCGEYSIYMNLLSSGSNILGFDTNKWDGKAAITGYLPTMTFAAGEYVLDGDVKINSGKTVTLDSGARIRCLDNCKINVSGTLQSNGTAENRVKIVGNNNDWDAIIVQKDGSFNAKYTDIRGAGNNNTVYTYGDLQLDHCRLTGGGTGVAANNKSGKLIIRNSKIACTDDDAKPLYLNVHDAEYVDISENTLTAGKKADKAVIFESVPDISCKFSDNTVMGAANYSLYLNLNSFNATAFTGFDTNTFENKVYLGTYTNINVDMSLPKATYQVNGMFVNEGKTLTLAPGTVILFDVAKADHPTYFHIAGTLNAKGTDDDPIIFTSVADPTYSDQSTEGYWGALWGMQTGTMNLSHVNFKYCGAGSAANGTTYGVNDVPALKVSGKCNADHLTFMHIYGTAICLYSGTTASSFEYTSFIDIGKYNAVNNTDISKFALYNQTSNSLDMKYCYWGTSSGRPSLYVPQVDGNGNIYYVWTNEGYKLYSPQGDVDWANTGLAEPVNSGNAYSLADLRKSVPQGSFVRQYTDLSMTNNAGSLDITRIYKSLASKNDSGLGYGWSLLGAGSIKQYSLKVVDIYGNISEQNVPGKYAAVLPDGNTYIITKNDNGTYTCNDGRFKVTCDSTYGYFTLTSNDKTVYSFDTAGRLTSVTERSGYQKKYYYGTTGCITSYTDSSGRNYSFTYEGTHIKTITDAQGRSVTYGYSGNYLTSVTDALGNITKYTYDTAGNLTSITDGNGSVLEQATYFDSYMNTHGRLNSTTDANGKTTYYTYLDSRNELITCTSAGQYTYIWYDDNGNVIKTQYPDETTESTVYDASDNYGEASSVTDKYGVVTSCEKDSDGNIIKTVYSDGTTVVNTYDAYNNLTSTKDRAGVYTFYVYDANGKYQLKKAVAMNGQTTYNGTADSGYRVTSTEYYDISVYNIPGLIKSVTDPSGNKITYTYDQYGNTASMTDANGSKSSFTYDICGRLLKTVTPGGYVITNTYDADGNLTATKYNDGRTYTYTYDKAGNKLSETSPSGSCTAYTYYANSKVKTQTDALGNVTSYTYDANGNVETKTDAAGNIYRYVYDDMGRVTEEYLTDVSIGYELPVCSYIYNTCSGYYTVETRIFTDNVNYRSTLRYYDSNDRNYKTVNADGSTTQTVYNADGTAGSVKAANGAVIYYEYNADKKVTAQWSSLSDNTYSYIGYTYDASGNVLTETAGKTATALKTVPSDTYTTVYTYDGVGNKLSETQQNGKKTEYVYDAEGNVATLREYTGTSSFNKTDYSYDCMGKVTKVTQYLTKGDIAGNSVSDTTVVPVTVQYTYDSDENVVSQTDPDGTVTSNTYDKCGRLLSSTKGGASVSQTYDKVGNTATYTDALGNKTSYSYNAAGKVLKSTDALGGTTYNKYNLSGDLILTVSPENYKENTADFALSRTEYNYDNMGRETSCIQTYYDNTEKQWVSFTQYSSVYDAGGNTIAQTDALGNTSSYTYDLSGNASSYTDALGNKYLFTYDALGRKISQTDPDGTVTSFEYDGNGKTVRQTVSAGGKTMTVSAAYDLLGNQLSATDANGNTTAYTYNGLGNIKSCTLPGDVSVSALTTAYQYDMAGNTACVSDTSGKSIKMNYDANGHVTKQTESSVSGSDSISISYTYDKNGNVLTSTDANGNTTSYTYDALGRQTSSTLAGKTQYAAYNKNGDQISSTDIYGNISTCTYDALGRKTAVTDGSGVTVETLTYDNDSRQITSTDALGNTVTYGYDAMGNIISTTDPLGDVTESRYDFRGNVISSEDAMFNVTTYSYNGFNELVSVTDADGEVTSYTYDSNGNMTAYKDAAGRGDTYTYNCRNMVSTETDGNGHVQKFAYTPSGNISTQTMKDGTVITYANDVHGRVTSKSTGSQSVSYTYDNNGNTLSVSTASDTLSKTYDAFGRVTSKSETGTGTVRYTYDITEGLASGYHAQTSTDKDGITITDVYDRSSRLSSVMKNGTAAVTYTYLANGSLSQTDLPNGANAKYTYDKAGRLTSLINTDASGKAVNSYVYTYDRAGNMLTKADGTSVTTYSYDNENRLINVVYPGSDSVSYEYDGSGNRLYETETANGSTSTTKYFYDKANLLTSAKVINGDTVTENTVYSYDVNGNETAKATGGTTVLKNSYDSFGQLVTSTVTEGSKNTVVNNVYNGQGLRISKSVNGTATLYSYDENSHVTAEYSSDGTLKASNVYGLSLVSRTENSSTYYYLYNGHGDTTALMNGTTGSVDASYDYDVFGNIKNKTGSASGSYLYAGYSYDEQTGLYYLNARYYDPVTARFTSQDTYKGQTKDPLSLNRYTYCANEPIKYTDPTGHTLKSVYNKAKRVVKKAVTYVKTAAKKVVAFAKKAWGNIVSAARYAYNTVKSWVQNGIRYVSSKVQEYWDDAEDMCSSAVSEAKRIYEEKMKKIEAAKAQVSEFMSKVTYYRAETAEAINNVISAENKDQNLKNLADMTDADKNNKFSFSNVSVDWSEMYSGSAMFNYIMDSTEQGINKIARYSIKDITKNGKSWKPVEKTIEEWSEYTTKEIEWYKRVPTSKIWKVFDAASVLMDVGDGIYENANDGKKTSAKEYIGEAIIDATITGGGMCFSTILGGVLGGLVGSAIGLGIGTEAGATIGAALSPIINIEYSILTDCVKYNGVNMREYSKRKAGQILGW